MDVALQPVPTQLDEVATTVTGEQRLRELGRVVGRINGDSLVKAAPVASLSELLNARVPGLNFVSANDPRVQTTKSTDAATCPSPAPAGTGGIAGLPPLTDPGTDAARVDLLFRERAV